jgi:hypothetical protein
MILFFWLRWRRDVFSSDGTDASAAQVPGIVLRPRRDVLLLLLLQQQLGGEWSPGPWVKACLTGSYCLSVLMIILLKALGAPYPTRYSIFSQKRLFE